MGTTTQVTDRVKNHHVVFFDGVCNLCNGFVNFLIDRDKHDQFMFASLQSEEASGLLPNEIIQALDSVVVRTPEGKILRESDAVLELARVLGGVYSIVYVFGILPKGLRDSIYKWVARNRYRWFGKRDVCRVPTKDLVQKFV